MCSSTYRENTSIHISTYDSIIQFIYVICTSTVSPPDTHTHVHVHICTYIYICIHNTYALVLKPFGNVCFLAKETNYRILHPFCIHLRKANSTNTYLLISLAAHWRTLTSSKSERQCQKRQHLSLKRSVLVA